MTEKDPNVRYDEAWHRRVDRTLFGHVSDDTGVWVDGLLQVLSDFRNLALRVGLPLLGIIAVSAIMTALHEPPTAIRALLTFFGIHI